MRWPFLLHHVDGTGTMAYQRETWMEPLGGCTRSQNVFDLLLCVHGSESVSGKLVLVIKD